MRQRFGLLDGAWLMESAATQRSETFAHPQGVFTTMAVQAGDVVWVHDHYRRLVRDAAALGVSPLCAEEEFLSRCREVCARLSLRESGLKVIWSWEAGRPFEWISERPHGYTPETLQAGRRLLTLVCGSRSEDPLWQSKTLRYQEHLQAMSHARSAGFDDALWVTADGVLLETAVSSLYLVIDGHVVTPPASLGLLRGVARERLLAGGLASERLLALEDLERASEVFVSNALFGVMPVRAIGAQTRAPAPNGRWLEARRSLKLATA